MPHLDHTGPEGKGPKTGRKLGVCHKTEKEMEEMGTPGKGEGKKRHFGGGSGRGRRLKYDQKNNITK
jgi:hypothetical protein